MQTALRALQSVRATISRDLASSRTRKRSRTLAHKCTCAGRNGAATAIDTRAPCGRLCASHMSGVHHRAASAHTPRCAQSRAISPQLSHSMQALTGALAHTCTCAGRKRRAHGHRCRASGCNLRDRHASSMSNALCVPARRTCRAICVISRDLASYSHRSPHAHALTRIFVWSCVHLRWSTQRAHDRHARVCIGRLCATSMCAACLHCVHIVLRVLATARTQAHSHAQLHVARP